MKWLYRILRLVMCPHKYYQLENKPIQVFKPWSSMEMPSAYDYVCRCKYCGKIKAFRA